MTCEEVREHLSAFLDGELDVWQRRRVEAHLLGCADCRAAAVALEEMIAALQEGPWVPDDVLPTETILARLPDVAMQRERAINWVVLEEAGAGVLAVGVMLWVGLSLGPVNMLFNVLASLWNLLYRLVLGGPPPWTSASLLGVGLVGAAAVVLILNGLLVFGVRRL
jgi:predicted anti-sigma-YlaC factor YlaD